MTPTLAALLAALPRPAQELVDNPGFRYGLKGGLIAAAVLALPGLLSGRLFRPSKGPALGWAGVAPAVVLIVALHRITGFPRDGDGVSGYQWGVVALVAGGILAAAVPWRTVGVLLAAPGAYLVCWPGLDEAISTNRIVGFVAIVVLAPLLAEFDRRSSIPGLAVVLVAGSFAGIYSTVPDTEKAALLLTVAIPVGLVGWPLGLVHLGRAGSFAVVGTVVWCVERGGFGRSGSIVGGIGTLAFLGLAPLVWWLRARSERPAVRGLSARTSEWSPWTLGVVTVVVQCVVVLWASRVAGLREARTEAGALMVPAVVFAAWAAAVLPSLGPAGAAARTERPAARAGAGAGGDHAALGPARRARVKGPSPVTVATEHAALGPARQSRRRVDVGRGPAPGDHPALGPTGRGRRPAAPRTP